MSTLRRIALIAPDPAGRVHAERMHRLPGGLEIEIFSDLCQESTRLLAFRPEVVVAPLEHLDSEQIGGMRVLMHLLDDVNLVFVVPRTREVELAPLCAYLRGRTLLEPYDERDLASALALGSHDQPSPDVFVDVIRGLADEINNPLLFAKGYLQLLEASLEDQGQDVKDQLRSAHRGLDRIADSVGKLRLLHRASALQLEDMTQVSVSSLTASSFRSTDHEDSGEIRAALPDATVDTRVRADRDLLAHALDEFVGVARQVSKHAEKTILTVLPGADTVYVRVEFHGWQAADWHLPRAFEPYFLNRVLSGTSRGLALFLVQTIVHALGGQATARRDPDSASVRFELLFPRGV